MHYNSSAYVQDDPSIAILFQAQNKNCPAIEIEFSKVVDLNFKGLLTNKDALILDAYMDMVGDVIYWAERSDWLPGADEKDNEIWIAAKKVRWRILEGGLGHVPLYEYKPIEN